MLSYRNDECKGSGPRWGAEGHRIRNPEHGVQGAGVGWMKSVRRETRSDRWKEIGER